MSNSKVDTKNTFRFFYFQNDVFTPFFCAFFQTWKKMRKNQNVRFSFSFAFDWPRWNRLHCRVTSSHSKFFIRDFLFRQCIFGRLKLCLLLTICFISFYKWISERTDKMRCRLLDTNNETAATTAADDVDDEQRNTPTELNWIVHRPVVVWHRQYRYRMRLRDNDEVRKARIRMIYRRWSNSFEFIMQTRVVRRPTIRMRRRWNETLKSKCKPSKGTRSFVRSFVCLKSNEWKSSLFRFACASVCEFVFFCRHFETPSSIRCVWIHSVTMNASFVRLTPFHCVPLNLILDDSESKSNAKRQECPNDEGEINWNETHMTNDS